MTTLRSLVPGFLLGAVAALTVATAVAQEAMKDTRMDPEAQQIAQSTGPQHEWLQQFVGEWDITYKIYFAGPTGPAMETKGTATIETVLDGRFILERTSAPFTMPDGTSFDLEGMSMNGYDRHRNLFVASHADSMSTHLLQMTGSRSADGQRLTMYGQMDEPGIGVTGRMIKVVNTIQDENNHLVEIYDLHAGDDYRVIEIAYARKSG